MIKYGNMISDRTHVTMRANGLPHFDSKPLGFPERRRHNQQEIVFLTKHGCVTINKNDPARSNNLDF